MDYGEFEDALAQAHEIDDEGRKAFRARLRVLRDMGVPDLPKAGKGVRLSYSENDLWEAHLAVSLIKFGFPPLIISRVIKAVRKTDPLVYVKESMVDGGSDTWIRISVSVSPTTEAHVNAPNIQVQLGALDELIKRVSSAHVNSWQALRNLTQLTRQLP